MPGLAQRLDAMAGDRDIYIYIYIERERERKRERESEREGTEMTKRGKKRKKMINYR